MSDRYARFAATPAGRAVVSRLGLPVPPVLRRYAPGQPLAAGPVLLGGAPGGRLLGPLTKAIEAAGASVRTAAEGSPVGTDAEPLGAVVYDATGIGCVGGLRELWEFARPVVRSIAGSGRLLVLGTPPEATANARQAVAQRALEGFVRSAGKELRRGITAQLVYVAPGAEDGLASTVRFLLSARSAYVSGQVVRVGPAELVEPADWGRPLAGTVALVTGAARGIGAAVAAVLARDGAHVVCLDVPAAGDALAAVANRVGGSALHLDITAADAPGALVQHLIDRHGGVDVVVHNAGITRDRTLARMSAAEWDSVLEINLAAPERLSEALLGTACLRPGGRIVAVSSIAGIAGNAGQTNYATSKAGVIGLVQALAPRLPAGTTANAVAPGFVETRMTAAMPVLLREAGRRMNSMLQGGLPADVAEAVAWLANPASGGVNGNVLRVCGQSLLGA